MYIETGSEESCEQNPDCIRLSLLTDRVFSLLFGCSVGYSFGSYIMF